MDEFKRESAGQNIDPEYVKMVAGISKDLLGPAINLTHEQIQCYVNETITEEVIQGYENQILNVMKKRQEKYPSKKNDDEWLNYTNFVCKRRCQRVANKEMTNG